MAEKTEATTIIVFSADDDTANHRRARALSSGVEYPVRVVNKLSNKLEELMLVAKHRIVEVPMWLVLQDDKVVARLRGVPSPKECLALVEALL